MKYIDRQFNIAFSPQSLRIGYQPSEDTMMIAIPAMQSLEVMRNLKSAKSKECLFGLLNHTLTPMGARVLRNNMLQPPTNFDGFIRFRYDALEEMVTHEEMFREIRKGRVECMECIDQLLNRLQPLNFSMMPREHSQR